MSLDIQQWLDGKTDLTIRTIAPILKQEDQESIVELIGVLNEVLLQQLFNKGYIAVGDDDAD